MGAKYPEHREEPGREDVEESLLMGRENEQGEGIEAQRKFSKNLVRVVALAAVGMTLAWLLAFNIRAIYCPASTSQGSYTSISRVIWKCRMASKSFYTFW
jgi:hypothetical protein